MTQFFNSLILLNHKFKTLLFKHNHPKNKFEISESDKEFADWLKRFTEALKSA